MPSTASLAPAARTRCSCHSRRWGSAPETRSSRPRSRFSPPLGRSTTPAERLRKLRLHGGAKQYHHDEVGTNSRLDSMQAAVLLAKLPYLATWSERRREHAATYSNALADVSEVRTPVVDACNEPIFHQYTLRVERRDDLQAHLKSKGVGNAVYYPVPLHLQNCFSDLGYKRGRLPEAERAAGEVISLPIYPELTRDQVDYVADMIRGFYR